MEDETQREVMIESLKAYSARSGRGDLPGILEKMDSRRLEASTVCGERADRSIQRA